jgi:hypothetical protein
MFERMLARRDQAFVVREMEMEMRKSEFKIPVVPDALAQATCAPSAGKGGCASAASCGSRQSCSAGSSTPADDTASTLAQDGWILRTTIGEPRLSEVVENYRAMGFEVHVEYFANGRTATADGESSCTVCYDDASAGQTWGSVYLRQGKSAGPGLAPA